MHLLGYVASTKPSSLRDKSALETQAISGEEKLSTNEMFLRRGRIMLDAHKGGNEFNGTVHVGTAEDFNELAFLYRSTYPHATDANLAADIKPEEATAWINYRDENGEILVAMHIRVDGSLTAVHGFLALVEEARAVLARHGVRRLQIIHAPTLEPLAQRLEQLGLIGPKTAIIREYRFDAHSANLKVN
jgi:hypothetical protein